MRRNQISPTARAAAADFIHSVILPLPDIASYSPAD